MFFSIISHQVIHRGSFASVRDLVDAIRRFINAWNERCEPFVWTKDEIDVVFTHEVADDLHGAICLRHPRVANDLGQSSEGWTIALRLPWPYPTEASATTSA